MERINTYRAGPNESGHFGIFGGRYVAETLMPLVLELEKAYTKAKADPAFASEFEYYLRQYVGRPNPLYFAERLTRHCGGAKIYPSDGCGTILKIDDFAHVTLITGASEIGQGSDDILAAVVAAVLGVTTYDIRVYSGDTDLGPVDLGSFSSRVTLMAGNSAIQAAERAKAMLAEAVADKLQVPKERLRFADNAVFDTAAPEKRVTFQEAVCLGETRFGTIGTVWSSPQTNMPAPTKGGR